MSETSDVAVAVAGPPRAVIPNLELPRSFACGHCGKFFQNRGEARYHFLKLCDVLHPLAVPVVSEPLDSCDIGDFQPNPEWKNLGFRGRVAEILMCVALEWHCQYQKSGDEKLKRRAFRLRRKAVRFANCGRLGRSAVCSLYPLEHKFYVPHDCGVDFCAKCAQAQRRSLFEKYLRVVLNAVAGGIPKGWTLARVTFTLRSDGSKITPERVKKFNAGVRFALRKIVKSRSGYGCLFSDESGFELRGHVPDALRVAHGLNLHAHGLFLGPYLNWRRTRDLWAAETEKQFGIPSFGFYISEVRGFRRDPERAVRWALNHLLKYLSKPPAVTAERLADLILSFDGTKRVHALGKFYGECPKREKTNCPCPTCKRMGLERPGLLCFEGRNLADGGSVPRLALIRDLIAQGYLPLHGDGRTTDFGDVLAADALDGGP
jgi:hypothetical protein